MGLRRAIGPSQLRRIPGRVVAAVLVVAVCAMGVAPSSSISAARLSGSTCPKARVVDYATPLQSFPLVRKVPRSGLVPGAPKGLRIESLGPVLVGRGPVGFRLSSTALQHRYRLSWTVTLRSARLNSRGSQREALAVRRFKLSAPRAFASEPLDIAALASTVPAYYRADLLITRNRDGAVLARYGEYFRVVVPSVKARLGLSASVFHPGDTLAMRFENIGTAGLSYGPGVTLEHRGNSGIWIRVPRNPRYGWGPVGHGIPGGASGFCERLTLPSEFDSGVFAVSTLEPGVYRVSKEVHSRSGKFFVRASFDVK